MLSVHFTGGGAGRSPHGERGLKYVLPGDKVGALLSLPSRGAWIEIQRDVVFQDYQLGRSPHGERGLKCLRRQRLLL